MIHIQLAKEKTEREKKKRKKEKKKEKKKENKLNIRKGGVANLAYYLVFQL